LNARWTQIFHRGDTPRQALVWTRVWSLIMASATLPLSAW
jgi:hypothetical protein